MQRTAARRLISRYLEFDVSEFNLFKLFKDGSLFVEDLGLLFFLLF